MRVNFARAKEYLSRQLPNFECKCGRYISLTKFPHGTPLLMYKYCDVCFGGKDWMYAYSKVKDVVKKARMTNRVKSNADFISTCRCSKCNQQKVFGKWSYKDEWAVLPYSVFAPRSVIKKGFIYCEECSANAYAKRPARGRSANDVGSKSYQRQLKIQKAQEEKMGALYKKMFVPLETIKLNYYYVRFVPQKCNIKGFRRRAARIDWKRLNARMEMWAEKKEFDQYRLSMIKRTCKICITGKYVEQNFIERDADGKVKKDHAVCLECRRERNLKNIQKYKERNKSEEYRKALNAYANFRLTREECKFCNTKDGERFFYNSKTFQKINVMQKPWKKPDAIICHKACMEKSRKQIKAMKSINLEYEVHNPTL